MTPEQWKRVEELFELALEREPHERSAFLNEACRGDAGLRQEIETLIRHRQPTGQLVPSMAQDALKLFRDEKPRLESEARFIPGTVLAERYRIIGLLGKGGMGEVYRADDLRLSQPVALKFLPENLASDRSMLERFHREVRIARQISHPNICRVYDICEVEGQQFLSMEYIDGENLASLLRRIGRLPADKATEIASQLCAGLAASHEQGVLHRDLKPANVMIDGRGKARLMDFGLAGLAGEFRGREVKAGTPAYMAPEQIAGKEVSIKSDIYSLGLVLYEIYTGKKVFEASTLEDLMRLQETTAPPSISEYVKEADPLIERIILRCLEKEPRSRPSSVAQVAAALPGGDPLAAAVAAGETPSPEMVAAAPKEGALRPALAVACFSGFLVLLAATVFFSDRVMLHNQIPLNRAPEALADRAARIVNKLGYAEPPVDTAYGIELDGAYANYWDRKETSHGLWEDIRSGQPSPLYFWYRQSPRYLQPISLSNVSLSDPPADVSGMANAILDPEGRLVQFNAVPPQVVETNNQPPVPDWSILFAEAGLDPARFNAADARWVPPVACDARAAWEGVYPDRPDVPIRIEAAAFKGRPVYFQIIHSWELPQRQQEFHMSAGRKAASVLVATVFFAALLSAVLIARRNLRRGRGDRKGAYNVAIFFFSVEMIGSLLIADHVPTLLGELGIWAQAAGQALFISAVIWFLYMALEPYVRRQWPQLLISWNRLLAGGFRDPMVGRDILVGGLLGLSHTLAIYSIVLLSQLFGKYVAPTPGANLSIYNLHRAVAGVLSGSLVLGILIGMGMLFLLLLLYVFLRRKWLAAAALWVMHFAVIYLAFISVAPWPAVFSPFIIATAYVIAVARFGLLTTFALQIFFDLTFHFPITANLSSVYGGTTIFSVLLTTALAIYGFRASLEGQPLFRSQILSE